jgi:hypothetical protein
MLAALPEAHVTKSWRWERACLLPDAFAAELNAVDVVGRWFLGGRCQPPAWGPQFNLFVAVQDEIPSE